MFFLRAQSTEQKLKNAVNKPLRDMGKYLMGMERTAERSRDNDTNASHLKAKTRKYDEAYVALGFTVTTVGNKKRLACLLCLKILAVESFCCAQFSGVCVCDK